MGAPTTARDGKYDFDEEAKMKLSAYQHLADEMGIIIGAFKYRPEYFDPHNPSRKLTRDEAYSMRFWARGQVERKREAMASSRMRSASKTGQCFPSRVSTQIKALSFSRPGRIT